MEVHCDKDDARMIRLAGFALVKFDSFNNLGRRRDVMTKGAKALTANVSSRPSSVSTWSSAYTPALFIKTDRERFSASHSSSTCFTKRRHPWTVDRSAGGNGSTFPLLPKDWTAITAASMRVGSLPCMRTSYPFAAKCFAVVIPMPSVEPVTRTARLATDKAELGCIVRTMTAKAK